MLTGHYTNDDALLLCCHPALNVVYHVAWLDSFDSAVAALKPDSGCSSVGFVEFVAAFAVDSAADSFADSADCSSLPGLFHDSSHPSFSAPSLCLYFDAHCRFCQHKHCWLYSLWLSIVPVVDPVLMRGGFLPDFFVSDTYCFC